MKKYCDYCNAKREQYRTDYPVSNPKAFIIHHARGCRTTWDSGSEVKPNHGEQNYYGK